MFTIFYKTKPTDELLECLNMFSKYCTEIKHLMHNMIASTEKRSTSPKLSPVAILHLKVNC